MKLTLELVADATISSLYRLLTTKAWNTLRKKALEECNYQCAICGASGGQLNYHEQWEYDDETHTRRLARLVVLCQMCHLVKHMNNGYVPFEELVQHFMKVNDCSRQEFDEYYQRSCEERDRRNGDERGPVYWELDWGEYAGVLSQKGNLKQKYEWRDGDIVIVGLRKLRSHTD